MPPKAKEKAKAKPKPKPRAKAKVAARPPRLRLRRPSAREVKKKPGKEEEDTPVGEKGKELDLENLGVADLLASHCLVLEGEYFEAKVRIAGKGCGLVTKEGGSYLEVEMTGTSSEGMLRSYSGKTKKRIFVHLCGKGCTHKIWRDDLVHLSKAVAWKGPLEDWMENLKEVAPAGAALEPDELNLLRREARDAPLREDRRSPTRSLRREGREKKDKKAKEKGKEPKKKPLKMQAKKELSAVLGYTGLDPRPEVRRKFTKRARKVVQGKKVKKKKKKNGGVSSSTSGEKEEGQETSSTSSSSSGGEKGMGHDELYSSSTSVRRVAQEYPGVLTSSWIKDCQKYLMDSQGQVWGKTEGEIPPLAVQYFRNQFSGRMSGPMAREFLTIAYMVDLCLQGRTAECADIGTQRLKSLLSSHSGVHFTVAQKLEVVPPDRSAPASLEETQEAARAAREEARTFQRAAKSQPWQGSLPSESGKGGKGKESKGKKGNGKEGKSREGEKGGHSEGKK